MAILIEDWRRKLPQSHSFVLRLRIIHILCHQNIANFGQSPFLVLILSYISLLSCPHLSTFETSISRLFEDLDLQMNEYSTFKEIDNRLTHSSRTLFSQITPVVALFWHFSMIDKKKSFVEKYLWIVYHFECVHF